MSSADADQPTSIDLIFVVSFKDKATGKVIKSLFAEPLVAANQEASLTLRVALQMQGTKYLNLALTGTSVDHPDVLNFWFSRVKDRIETKLREHDYTLRMARVASGTVNDKESIRSFLNDLFKTETPSSASASTSASTSRAPEEPSPRLPDIPQELGAKKNTVLTAEQAYQIECRKPLCNALRAYAYLNRDADTVCLGIASKLLDSVLDPAISEPKMQIVSLLLDGPNSSDASASRHVLLCANTKVEKAFFPHRAPIQYEKARSESLLYVSHAITGTLDFCNKGIFDVRKIDDTVWLTFCMASKQPAARKPISDKAAQALGCTEVSWVPTRTILDDMKFPPFVRSLVAKLVDTKTIKA